MIDSSLLQDRSVCVLGLGYVGLTLAAAMADVGFEVMGVEIRDSVLDKLGDGRAHFFEPGLDACLQRVIRTGKFQYAKRIPSDCKSKVFIITVGTPLDENRKPSMKIIESVSREIAAHLKDGDLVIMRSTVKLGTTRNVVVPILAATGKKFELAFCPERTLEGSALRELRELPQIVGGLTFGAAMRASQIFQMLTPTVVRVDDPETAEMIKLMDNAQRDVLFAYGNEVARLCDAVGISAHQVITAGRLAYPRTNIPMPGPVGGPCLEKDPYILAEGFAHLGLSPEITLTARKLNERQPWEVAKFLKDYSQKIEGFPRNPLITLMGIAFKGKPVTDDLRGTMAKHVLTALKEAFPQARFRAFDPVVSAQELREFGLEPTASLEDAFQGSNINLILNNHPIFEAMNPDRLAATMAKPGLIYDFWNIFTNRYLYLPSGISYIALGSHGRVQGPNPA